MALVSSPSAALARGDTAALAGSAHALKGSIGLFAQAGAYDAARRLEMAARDGKLAGLDVMLTELENEAARLLEELRAARASLRE